MITKFQLVKVIDQQYSHMNSVGLFGIVSAVDERDAMYACEVSFFHKTNPEVSFRTSWWYSEKQLKVIADLSFLIKDIKGNGILEPRYFDVTDAGGFSLRLAGLVQRVHDESPTLIFEKLENGKYAGHDGKVSGSLFFNEYDPDKRYWFLNVDEILNKYTKGLLSFRDEVPNIIKESKLIDTLKVLKVGDTLASKNLRFMDDVFTIKAISPEFDAVVVKNEKTLELITFVKYKMFIDTFYIGAVESIDDVKASEKKLLDFLGVNPKEEISIG